MTEMDIHDYIQIAPNRRSFQTRDGVPVFWLGDTAWSCPGRASWEEWTEYVDERARQGFNVIQMNALPQHDAYQPIFQGRKPFALLEEKSEDGRIFKWNYDEIDEAYFDTLSRMIEYANGKGMLVALIVVWFEHVPGSRPTVIPPDHPGMSVRQATEFGCYLVRKMRDLNVVWIISGDDDYVGDGIAEFYDAVGKAVKEAELYGRLVTTHPVVKSGDAYHHAEWLDFNMVQTGHGNGHHRPPMLVREEWDKMPPKPVLNAEPCYEWHPDCGRKDPVLRIGVRRACWRSVLAGSLTGLTYGAEGIWNWARKGDFNRNRSPEQVHPWQEALKLPGAQDLVRMKRLLTALPWQDLKPAQERLLNGSQENVNAAASADGRLLLAYLPEKGTIELDVSGLDTNSAPYWWNPESGEQVAAAPIGGCRLIASSPFEQDALLIIHSLS
ncbi:hypothetical protein DL346_11500 [Paenibacillus montanisoli]|uniref:Apiosidase-like catalytic domain-containing protein n=2 Tax=Paenibacillus montanisoli TaxID=2081970 RepID=A0A328U1V9_9BACL|nr:hypothetical protein DL346_11500 [Paenibacillus montanisoli]